jgi:hypothetical protein
MCLTKHHAVRMYWGVEVYLHEFLTSALDGGEWSGSPSGRFTLGVKVPCNHWVGCWLCLRVAPDAVAKRRNLITDSAGS